MHADYIWIMQHIYTRDYWAHCHNNTQFQHKVMHECAMNAHQANQSNVTCTYTSVESTIWCILTRHPGVRPAELMGKIFTILLQVICTGDPGMSTDCRHQGGQHHELQLHHLLLILCPFSSCSLAELYPLWPRELCPGFLYCLLGDHLGWDMFLTLTIMQYYFPNDVKLIRGKYPGMSVYTPRGHSL